MKHLLAFNAIYNMKDSWETYPYEEHDKHTTPDRKTPKYFAVWRDHVSWRATEVTQTQHEVFRKLTDVMGHDAMMNKGINLLSATKLFGKNTIRSMIKKGVFTIQSNRLWLTSQRIPCEDEFIENGLREGGKVCRRETK